MPVPGYLGLRAGNIVGRPLLARSAEGDDVVGTMQAGHAIGIRSAPGIEGHGRVLDVGPAPHRRARRLLHQSLQALGGGGIAAGVEIIEVDRIGEGLDLQMGGLLLGTGEVIQHAWCHQPHDQANDHQDHQGFDQGEC